MFPGVLKWFHIHDDIASMSENADRRPVGETQEWLVIYLYDPVPSSQTLEMRVVVLYVT